VHVREVAESHNLESVLRGRLGIHWQSVPSTASLACYGSVQHGCCYAAHGAVKASVHALRKLLGPWESRLMYL
jgi:fructose-1,6-bisphosphatase/inositol monophosphatase family enzyme